VRDERRLELPADSDGARIAAECVRDLLVAVDPAAAFRCELAVAEAAANVVEHAYEGRPGGRFTLVARLGGNRFSAAICDNGRAFVPSLSAGLPPPEAEGSRGIPLMISVMERLRFLRVDGENRVLMAQRTQAPLP
jgi:serine/threonine-protein kinase RsbW